jgi:hypothetical protein
MEILNIKKMHINKNKKINTIKNGTIFNKQTSKKRVNFLFNRNTFARNVE